MSGLYSIFNINVSHIKIKLLFFKVTLDIQMKINQYLQIYSIQLYEHKTTFIRNHRFVYIFCMNNN